MDAAAATDPLLAALRRSGQLDDGRLAAAGRAWAAGADATALANALREAKAVTGYQFRKVRGGRVADLLFGRYLIFDKIGEGGMGKVYRAADTNLARLVALKVIRPHLLANTTVLKRYKREAHATATLDHPNIVHLYDADEANGRNYLAMEYVDGSDLGRLVREAGPLPPAEACEYLRQAALGLHHAHAKGFIHRDVKPSNLLVSGDRAVPGSGGRATLKILDMGLVRSLEPPADGDSVGDLTRDNTVVGTPDYMAPEQASDSRTVDGRADLYSLGCTLVYLLTGKPPYSEPTALGRLLAHQRNPVPDLGALRPGLPAGLAEVAARLLAKKRDDRYATGAEVAAALAPFAPEGSALAQQPLPIASAGGRPTVAQGTPAPLEEIAHPSFDVQSSPDIEVKGDAAPVRPKRKGSGFPLWLTLLLGGMTLLIPAIAYVLFARPKATDSTEVPPPRRTAPTVPGKPPEPKPQFRPLPELLPSDSVAVFVIHPKAAWEADHPPGKEAKARAALDGLAKGYGFDPRQFDRLVLSFLPSGACVAAGEGMAVGTPEWLAEFAKPPRRVLVPADAHGVQRVKYRLPAGFVAVKEDAVCGAVLPHFGTTGAMLLSETHFELNALLTRQALGEAPKAIAPPLLAAATKAATSDAPGLFAASGAFALPLAGPDGPQTLAECGVTLFTAEFRHDSKWSIEVAAYGPEEAPLKRFLSDTLPRWFDGNPTATVAKALRAATPRAGTVGADHRLAASVVIDAATLYAAADALMAR